MKYPCFKCDVELVPGARFCHQCGTPILGQDGRDHTAEAAVPESERTRIKHDVIQAVQIPVSTRMVQTVLPPARRPRPAARPPWWRRLARAPLWRRPALWVALVAVPLGVWGYAMIRDVADKARQGGQVFRIATRLAVRCPRVSRAEITEYIARIHAASGGHQASLADSAELFEYVLREVPTGDGDCSRVAATLARPGRFSHFNTGP